MPQKSIPVVVGLVTYNSADDLPACFEGLRAQTYADIRIMAVDNASKDGGVEWLRQHAPECEVIVNARNAGFGTAHNQIIRRWQQSPGDFYYLALNPDVILEPAYIAELVKLVQETGAGWAIGKLRLKDSADHLYSVGHAVTRDGYAANIGYELRDEGQWSQRREVFGAPGAAVLMTQAFMCAVAPSGEVFDEDLFLYYEDVDLDWRARRLGWACWYSPDAVAAHRGGQANESLAAQGLANRYLSVIKNADLLDLWFYNLPLMIFHCLMRLIFTPRSGVQMIRLLVARMGRMLAKRQPAAISRRAMHEWFAWSRRQPTGRSHTWADRWARFQRRG